MTTAIYRSWVERVTNPTIAHGSVIQLARNVYPLSRGYDPQGKRSALEELEAVDIIDTLHDRARLGDGGPRAEAKNEERGRKWLADFERRLGLPHLDWAHIDTFRLVGFHVYWEADDRYGRRMDAAPIWRCHWRDQPYLDYAPTAWQSTASTKDRDFWWMREGSL